MARNNNNGGYIEDMMYADPWDNGQQPEAGDYNTPNAAQPDPWGQQNNDEPTGGGGAWDARSYYTQQVKDQYKKWLGRDASDQELNDQFGGNYSQNHWQAVMNAIQNSPEARAYAARQTQGSQQPTQQPAYDPRLEGFEQDKLSNTNHAATSPKYAFGQMVASGNYGYQDGGRLLADLQAKYPELFGGWQYQNDKFRFTGDPNSLHESWNGVDEVDFVRNFSQGGGSFDPNQAAFWWGASSPQSRSAPQGGTNGQGSGSPGYGTGGGLVPYSGSGSGPGPGSGTPGGGGQYGPPPGISDQLWNTLMQRAQQGLDVDRMNPQIRAQADAYGAQATRVRRDHLNDMAESNSPYATGAMQGERRMTAEKLGQNIGGFEASLIGKEIEAKRNEIQHALDTMGEMLTEQQRQQLQLQIAQMNDSLERLKSDRQNSQYYAGLDQDADQFGQRMGYDYDRLGFDMDDRDRYWDWDYRNF